MAERHCPTCNREVAGIEDYEVVTLTDVAVKKWTREGLDDEVLPEDWIETIPSTLQNQALESYLERLQKSVSNHPLTRAQLQPPFEESSSVPKTYQIPNTEYYLKLETYPREDVANLLLGVLFETDKSKMFSRIVNLATIKFEGHWAIPERHRTGISGGG